ncbi:MAG: hypothetical protein K6A89_01475 [Treponema sp.]|nr:hypothetical protein [Treponema sp.]
MNYYKSTLRSDRACKIAGLPRNKKLKFFIFLLFGFSSFLFASSLDDIEKDVQSLLNYGNRPISFGIDKYINSQGNFQDFGVSTFAAINGKGFFCLLNDDGKIILTRNGFFRWNENGFLVNSEGYRILNKKSNLKEKDYKFITIEDFEKINKKSKKTTSLADQYKNDIEASPYLIAVPLDNPKIIDNEYLICDEIQSQPAEIIYGAREYNSTPLSELYDLCCRTFDECNGEEFADQKKRIVAKFEVVISYFLNNLYAEEKYKNELEMMLYSLKERI